MTGRAVVVVAYRGREPLRALLSVLDADLEVVVVDNSARDEPHDDVVAKRPGARWVDAGGNVGFGAAANLGVAVTNARHVVFVNPDAAPRASDIERLVAALVADPALAACGPTLREYGRVRGGGGWQPSIARCIAEAIGLPAVLPTSGVLAGRLPARSVSVGWVAGTCLAVDRSAFRAVGGFDPRLFLYTEDMDLGRRLSAAGWHSAVLGDVVVDHARGGSSDVDASGLWEQRARAYGSYVRAHNGPRRADVMCRVAQLGYLLRGAVFAVLGRRERLREMRAYATAVVDVATPPSRA